MSDLIERQAAIGAVNTALFPKINTAKDAEKALRALPSAQPERIRARWEKQVLGWKCSNCTASTNDFGAREFNFCPACGADMRGGR